MHLPRVTIVGSDTLLGRDVEEVFAAGAPDFEMKSVASDVEGTILAERDGEAVVIRTLDEAPLESSRLVVLCGSASIGREALGRIRAAPVPPAIIDLSYALEDEEDAVVAAPLSEPPEAGVPDARIHVIAHAAAATVAELLRRLDARLPLRRAIVHVLEPASERGKAGIEELQHQTAQLLSFKPVPKAVFDEQLSFNMLAGYGSEAPISLQSVEERIMRHLAALLGRGTPIPMPSLRLIQAPVFHAHCFSVWAEFKRIPSEAALGEALTTERIDLRGQGEGLPTNLAVAARGGMTVGRVERDRTDRRAVWFWIAADNYRTRAENALCLARLLIGREARA